VEFSAEILQVRKAWDDIFKVLKEKLSTKNTVPLCLEAKLSFRNERDKDIPRQTKTKVVHHH